jgi:hypothetical protein
MITLYKERIPEVSFERFIWRHENKLLSWLVGINLVGDKHNAMFEPIYQAYIEYWFSTGMLYILFPKKLLILMQRKPWIYIERIEDGSQKRTER